MNDLTARRLIEAARAVRRFDDLVAEALTRITELMPWDLVERRAASDVLLLDVREPDEFRTVQLPGSINVPRGVLETACEWDYDTTVPALAAGREREIVILCRSGKRSALAADVMQHMGFTRVTSLRTGLRGWNDYDQPLVDGKGRPVDGDRAEELLSARRLPQQAFRRR